MSGPAQAGLADLPQSALAMSVIRDSRCVIPRLFGAWPFIGVSAELAVLHQFGSLWDGWYRGRVALGGLAVTQLSRLPGSGTTGDLRPSAWGSALGLFEACWDGGG
jgi:hypothetical protein